MLLVTENNHLLLLPLLLYMYICALPQGLFLSDVATHILTYIFKRDVSAFQYVTFSFE